MDAISAADPALRLGGDEARAIAPSDPHRIPGRAYGLVSTLSLEPEPIPLKLKVVLVGERLLFYLLQAYDPDFGKLFRVAADFEEHLERTPEPASCSPASSPRGRAATSCCRSSATRLRACSISARAPPATRARSPPTSSAWSNCCTKPTTARARRQRRHRRRAISRGDRRPAPPRRPPARRGPGSDPARQGADRHRGRDRRPGERLVGIRSRRLRLRRAGAHHRHHPPGRRPGDRHPARSRARRRDPFQGRDDPVRVSGGALFRQPAALRSRRAWCSSRPTATSTATAPRSPSCAPCSPRSPTCRSGRR